MKKIFYTVSTLCLLVSVANATGEVVKEHVHGQLIPAIKAKEAIWVDSFSRYTETQKQFEEAMAALEEDRDKQVEIVDDIVLENVPADIDGSLSKKAAEVSKLADDAQEKQFEGLLGQVATESMLSETNAIKSIDNTFDRITDRILVEGEKTEGGIESPLSNSSTVFSPKTYADHPMPGEDDETATNVSTATEEIESELLDAIDFVQLVINPYNTESSNIQPTIKYDDDMNNAYDIASVSRKSMAFSVMNKPIVMRTKVEGAGLGEFAKVYMTDLESLASEGMFEEWSKDMPDDISKYELMDLLFSKVVMNPAWHSSLAKSSPKSLRRRKLEFHAFLTMINWETSKMLEKLAAISASNMAVNTDQNQ